MKEGWTYKKLGEVCEVINGLWKGKKPPYVNVGVIRNANFTKDFTLKYDNIEYLDVEERQYAKRKLLKGDLIIEKSGGSEKQPVGRAVLFDRVDGEFCFSNFTSVLRIKDKDSLLSKFLFIYLLYVYKRGDTLKMQKATTGIHNIVFDKYLSIEIPCLSFSEQQRIVARLDSAFAHIDELKANAEKQLREARALFQKALTKAMEPKEGWEEKTLGDICSDVRYGTSTPSNENGEYKYLRMNNITNDGFLDVSHYKTISLPEKELEKCLVKKGDIIFNRTNSRELVGKSCVFTEEEKMVIAGYLIRIRLKEGFEPQFVTYNMNMQRSLGLFQYLIVGAVHQANISANNIQKVLINYPPLSEQRRIVERLDALSENVRKLEGVQKQVLTECDALKQAMLREIFE